MACEISKLVEQLQAKAEKGLVNGLSLDVAVIRLKAAYGQQQIAKVKKKVDKAVTRAQEKYEEVLGTKIERTGTAIKERVEHTVSNNSTFEVSTKGDTLGKKFSALNAKLKDGRTIEQAWAEAKGYKTIEEAKGKSAKVKGFKYKEVYFGLWEQWAEENPDLIKELAEKTEGMSLVDSFAKTENNQANALTQIVENYRKGEGVTSENGMLKVQTFNKANPVMVFADGKTSKVFNTVEELVDFAFEYNSIMSKAGKIVVPQDQRMVGQIFGMLKNANIPFKPIRVELAKGKDEAGTERGLYEVKGHRITMYYNNKHTGANPAQVLLHEYVHAITLEHLDKNVELKKKVRALMDHVAKKNEGLTTWYAMKDEKEFLAEAVAEPKFREALASIEPMNKRSVLQYVKDLFKELLDSLTNANIKETNAFTEALELVVEVANAGEAPFDTAKVVPAEESDGQIANEEYTTSIREMRSIQDLVDVKLRRLEHEKSADSDSDFDDIYEAWLQTKADLRKEDSKKSDEIYEVTKKQVKKGQNKSSLSLREAEFINFLRWNTSSEEVEDLRDVPSLYTTSYDYVYVTDKTRTALNKLIESSLWNSFIDSVIEKELSDKTDNKNTAAYKETIPTKGKVQLSSDIIEAAKNCK